VNTRHLRAEDLRGKRARGLVRESTADQGESWSPARQRSDLIRAAAELGLTGLDKWYVRIGSGEAEHVSELQEALADARAGEFDVLLVVHTSRFARNRAEAVEMKRAFRKAGVVIYFAAQRLISGTYAGSLTEGINEVIDEHENEQRRYWIAGGQRERQLSGRWVGRIPFGYRKALVDYTDGTRGWDGNLEVDPIEAEWIRWLFAQRGLTQGQLADALNDRGIVPRNGGRWTRHAIAYILANPLYAGTFVRYRTQIDRRYYPAADPADGRRTIENVAPAILAT
jgi:DNA invertase Pin-like site-specific DNA recombinase